VRLPNDTKSVEYVAQVEIPRAFDVAKDMDLAELWVTPSEGGGRFLLTVVPVS
jgi:hypothetical protein